MLINTKDLPANTPVRGHPCPRTGVSADMSGFLESAEEARVRGEGFQPEMTAPD